ncbi:MAG: ABC transporter ATP-binding protein [Ignavibacteriales bacterium]|nr:ABC transporter ATP-binding protein [Ignavibacteriales bacterium]
MEIGGDPMNSISITVTGLSKDFNRSSIFKDISFSLASPASLSITGKNGAGKSTLSKILAGLLSSTRGSITYSADEKQIGIEEFKHHIGFVSPYLNLYDEFTALENLQFLSRIRAAAQENDERIKELLVTVGLWNRRNDSVGTFSSGMKQRLKYAFALLHHPAVLILDEPTSNLDTEGIEVVKEIVRKQKETNILIIATNNKEEAHWCAQQIQVGTIQQ